MTKRPNNCPLNLTELRIVSMLSYLGRTSIFRLIGATELPEAVVRKCLIQLKMEGYVSFLINSEIRLTLNPRKRRWLKAWFREQVTKYV